MMQPVYLVFAPHAHVDQGDCSGVYTSVNRIFLNNTGVNASYHMLYAKVREIIPDAPPTSSALTLSATKNIARMEMGSSSADSSCSTSATSSSSQNIVSSLYLLTCKGFYLGGGAVRYGLYSDKHNAMAAMRPYSALYYPAVQDFRFSITEIQLNKELKYCAPEPISWAADERDWLDWVDRVDDAPLQWTELYEGRAVRNLEGAP